MSFFYPTLDHQTVKNLLVVRQLVDDHPSYFLDSSYSPALEADLLTLFKRTKQVVHELPTEQEQEDIDTLAELQTLYRNLKLAKPNGSEDPDAMAYFRTATSLMEKILTLQERGKGIKEVSTYHTVVLDFLSEICNETQIEEFISRLKEATK